MTGVRLYVAGVADSDPDECAALARRMQEELPELKADVSCPPAARRWRRRDRAGVGAAGVSLADSLPPVVAALRGTLGRRSEASIMVKVDGDRLAFSDASPREPRALIAAWMGRHGG